jgi:PAS domain S-box-containing protein
MTSGAEFAGRWAAALAAAAPALGNVSELVADLQAMASKVVEAIRADGVDPGLGREIGTVLIAHGLRTTAVIGPTVRAVVTSFADEDIGRVSAVAASVAEGVATVQREHLLTEQEDMQRAAVAAVRAAEAEQRTSEARFRALFAQAAVGIGIVDERGRVLDGNTAWAAMMGFSIDEMRGEPMWALVQAGSEPIAMVRFREVLTGVWDQFRLEFTHVDRHGRRLELDLSASRVTTPEGQPDFVVGVAVDVTDRRRLQDRLWHEARHDPLTGVTEFVGSFGWLVRYRGWSGACG